MADDKKKRRGKKKKDKVKISLWINQTAYTFGCLCTFCQKRKALVHCPECSDFYCTECDGTTHQVEKRKDHVRSVISGLDLKAASGLVTRCVRYAQHHLELRRKTRAKIRRFFDRRTLCHYYYNPVYGSVSWRKPYCIRLTDLFPFLDEYMAATWIQGMYHQWYARYRVVKLLKKFYRKVFDRARGLFYYSYHGPSKLVPKQSWRKSVLFGRRAYPYDILPIYTRDVAAVVIQRKWRATLIRALFCNLVRISYVQEWDAIDGVNKYLNINTKVMQDEKPKLLRCQPWDPNFVPEWDPTRVSLFLRRIGLKQYATVVREYGVDGGSVLMLDGEDYENMNIHSKIHRRKIEVELRRIFNPKGGLKGVSLNENHAQKRDKIRKAKIYKESATTVQRVYRGYRVRVDIWNMKEVARVMRQEEERKELVGNSGQWWLERTQTYRLPPVKEFGRKRDHLSCAGWGHWGPGGVWQGIGEGGGPPGAPSALDVPFADEYIDRANEAAAAERALKHQIIFAAEAVVVEKEPVVVYTDSNASRQFSEGLSRSGYDRKRYQISRGNAIFSSKPAVDPAEEKRREAETLAEKKRLAAGVESDEEDHGLGDN